MNGCPSHVTLEQFLLTPHAVPERVHIESCAHCQGRLTEMKAVGEQFRQYVLPATLEPVVARASPGRASSASAWKWLVPSLGVAAAAVLALWGRVPPGPPADYVGVKGTGLSLEVFVEQTDARVLPVTEGDAVPASARWRASVGGSASCHLWLFTVDAAGAVSRVYPVEGEGGAPRKGTGELPGGAQLDGAAGPERVFAVCGATSLPWAQVEAAARETFSPPGAAQLRALRQLRGLPEGTAQASLLLEKTP